MQGNGPPESGVRTTGLHDDGKTLWMNNDNINTKLMAWTRLELWFLLHDHWSTREHAVQDNKCPNTILQKSYLRTKMHIMIIFLKENETDRTSLQEIGILKPVKNSREHGCARTLRGLTLIGVNAPNKGYNFVVLRMHLQHCIWVMWLKLSGQHVIEVILTFRNKKHHCNVITTIWQHSPSELRI